MGVTEDIDVVSRVEDSGDPPRVWSRGDDSTVSPSVPSSSVPESDEVEVEKGVCVSGDYNCGRGRGTPSKSTWGSYTDGVHSEGVHSGVGNVSDSHDGERMYSGAGAVN